MTNLWLGSFALIGFLLTLDLCVFRKKAHAMPFREALTYTLMWIGVALLFNLFIYFHLGTRPAIDFFTGYLVEYSLSVDNLFVFMLIFSYFQVPQQYQQRVLFFGILGAVAMRGIFILLGVTLLHLLHWSIYIFGALLIVSGIKLFSQNEEHLEPEKNIVYRMFKKILPMHPEFHGQDFVVNVNGIWKATPLLLVLISVEISDLIFAVDSIPAIFGITTDPFIIFTSNIFAVLGLRSLYFLLSSSLTKIELLQPGLALILIFVGVKMLTESFFPIPNHISLLVIITILTGAVVGSIILKKRRNR